MTTRTRHREPQPGDRVRTKPCIGVAEGVVVAKVPAVRGSGVPGGFELLLKIPATGGGMWDQRFVARRGEFDVIAPAEEHPDDTSARRR
jgi:hypothetical protein